MWVREFSFIISFFILRGIWYLEIFVYIFGNIDVVFMKWLRFIWFSCMILVWYKLYFLYLNRVVIFRL